MATTPKPAAPTAAPAAEPAQAVLVAEPMTIRTAIAHRIHAAGHRSAGPSLLDFLLVFGVLLIVGGVLYGLFQVTDLKATLPIIASMASALISAVISGYAAYRWGASDAMKKANASAPS